ncbi:MAG: ABC transporter ATP-binding protein [Candidatus Limnocylindria bacterium]
MASVTYDRVSKQFGSHDFAVKDLSLEVRDGEFLVLVGPSGCGKSTALRMLAGLERQSSGDIRIADRVVNDVPPKDRDIAMVFQNYALYPHMSVYDNIAFGLKLRGTPREEIDGRVREVGRILDIGHLLERRPKELSGGQRQRVAVGRAIARHPAVFLMDEPLSNLDAKLRIQTRAELQKIHRDIGRTTIYVTHDQVEAMTMGDRIAVMRLGILQQLATPEDLHDRPANLFVAGFIGSPSMNFFPATVQGTPGEPVADAGLFRAPVPAKVAPGSELIIGVRPEDLVDLSTVPQDGQLAIDARVDVAEYLGNEFQLHLTADEKTFVARVPTSTRAQVGAPIRVGFDLAKMHVFDRASEEAIR